jgi:hypothetical protein
MPVQELRASPNFRLQRFQDGGGVEVRQPVRRIGEIAVITEQFGYSDLADAASRKVLQRQRCALLRDDLPASAVVLQTVK